MTDLAVDFILSQSLYIIISGLVTFTNW